MPRQTEARPVFWWGLGITGAIGMVYALTKKGGNVTAPPGTSNNPQMSSLFPGAEPHAAYVKNFKRGRASGVDTVVVHTAEGSATSAANWFGMDHGASELGPSSSHFIIGKDGKLYQAVGLEDTAYHAGNSAVNNRSVGIELEGFADKADTFTEPMMNKLGEVIRKLKSMYPAIPLIHGGPPGILGHNEVDQKTKSKHTDPGPYFPWNVLMGRLQNLV